MYEEVVSKIPFFKLSQIILRVILYEKYLYKKVKLLNICLVMYANYNMNHSYVDISESHVPKYQNTTPQKLEKII